jgi:hypothetical protein
MIQLGRIFHNCGAPVNAPWHGEQFKSDLGKRALNGVSPCSAVLRIIGKAETGRIVANDPMLSIEQATKFKRCALSAEDAEEKVIVLNSTKELIEVERWEDIQSRPGFSGNLNPEFQQLEAIIGKYHFRDRIRCGQSNCHTPHVKGYIVVTKDGCETNLGKDCGRKYFGIDFDTLSAKFDRDVTEKKHRDKLWVFVSKLDEVKHKISEIREQPNGAKWVSPFSKLPLKTAQKLSFQKYLKSLKFKDE